MAGRGSGISDIWLITTDTEWLSARLGFVRAAPDAVNSQLSGASPEGPDAALAAAAGIIEKSIRPPQHPQISPTAGSRFISTKREMMRVGRERRCNPAMVADSDRRRRLGV